MLRRTAGLILCIGVFVAGAAAQTTVTNNNDGTSGTVPVYNGSATLSGTSPISVSGGNVGIGTTNPEYNLQISAPSFTGLGLLTTGTTGFGPNIKFDSTSMSGGHRWTLYSAGTSDGLSVGGFGIYDNTVGRNRLAIDASGNVGIGTTSPSAKLEVDGNIKLTSSGASITFADGTQQTTAWTGTVCGGDYAESVNVTGDRKKYEPGDVLVIDPNHPGKFLKSSKPYSTSVLGVYSTKPGLVGRRQGMPKSADAVPMAMVGIVPTKVSAENGPIRPGDLLVTASLPGYAMKGTDHTRMLGAVIGKALGRLDKGTGVIEVGVTLQ